MILNEKPFVYTYEDMKEDLQTFKREYPSFLSLYNYGKTYDGRGLHHVLIGEKNASRHILINASVHGREYITTRLVMHQMQDFLKKLSRKETALPDTAIHVIPMVNPDGVSISQSGMDGVLSDRTKKTIQNIYHMDKGGNWKEYLRQWKANAEGIDINRNFDAQWEAYIDGSDHPSSDCYKGTSAGCTKEAQILIHVTQKYPVVRTISYHTQGEVIYWYFGQQNELLRESERFAQKISKATGYPLDADYKNLDPAGYKDWAIDKCKIPSLTIETGKGKNPIDSNQFKNILRQNETVWETLIEDAAVREI